MRRPVKLGDDVAVVGGPYAGEAGTVTRLVTEGVAQVLIGDLSNGDPEHLYALIENLEVERAR